MDYAKQYQEYLTRANQALEKACETFLPEESELCRAARYSLLGGGKRIRAVLVLAVCDMLNGSAEAAEQFAAAVEMLHCYSLIHDDLPCMDNDDLRRGKPTNHKVYGETLAVLAGDAMQPEAFRLMAEAPCLPAENRLEAVRTLARASGADGMEGGQELVFDYDVRDAAGLTVLNRLKTGVMISAAAELGCIASEMPATMRAQALVYDCVCISPRFGRAPAAPFVRAHHCRSLRCGGLRRLRERSCNERLDHRKALRSSGRDLSRRPFAQLHRDGGADVGREAHQLSA